MLPAGDIITIPGHGGRFIAGDAGGSGESGAGGERNPYAMGDEELTLEEKIENFKPTVSKYRARWEDGEGGSAADVVRLYGPEEIREELAISHSSGVWLRCLAFDAELWW